MFIVLNTKSAKMVKKILKNIFRSKKYLQTNFQNPFFEKNMAADVKNKFV